MADHIDKLSRKEMIKIFSSGPIGAGPAKLSKNSVDVLSRFIRRFRTRFGKPPTVPEKFIKKARENERSRLGLSGRGLESKQLNVLQKKPREVRATSGSAIEQLRTNLSKRGLGFTEKTSSANDLQDFLIRLERLRKIGP